MILDVEREWGLVEGLGSLPRERQVLLLAYHRLRIKEQADR